MNLYHTQAHLLYSLTLSEMHARYRKTSCSFSFLNTKTDQNNLPNYVATAPTLESYPTSVHCPNAYNNNTAPPLSPHTHAHSPLHQNLQNVSRFGLAVRSQAGKQKDLGSNLLRLSFLFKSCLWTLSCDFVPHNYETLKWLSSLPILMQKSF